jgi:hypothetical protein
MTLEKRDWWWMIGMLIVGSSGFDTREWSEPGSAVLGGIVGTCLDS